LRQLIFSDEPSRHWLNDLLHPLIRQTITDQLKATTSAYAILVAPLLIENKLTPLVDRVLVVDVAPQVQLTRTCQRDGSSQETIKSIMDKQVSQKERVAAADDIIDNNQTDIAHLNEQVATFHAAYLKLC